MSSLHPPPVYRPSLLEIPDSGGVGLFHAAPGVGQLALYPVWIATLARIMGALDRPGVVVLVGPTGSGKTLMLRHVASCLDASGRTPAVLDHAGAGRRDLPRRPDVVLIDDAGQLAAEPLLALVRHGRPVMVVAGVELIDRLRVAGLEPAVVSLPLLPHEEAVQFLTVQLTDARQPATLIQPAAIMHLVERAEGVARTLQMLAGLAVFVALLADAPQVTPSHVEQAARIQAGTAADDEDDGDGDEPAATNPNESLSGLLPVQPGPVPVRSRMSGLLAMVALAVASVGGGALIVHHRLSVSPRAEIVARPDLLKSPERESAVVFADPPAAVPHPAPPPAPVAFPVRTVQPLALPPMVPVHVVVAYAALPGAAVQATLMADTLRRQGYQVAQPRMGSAREEPSVSFAFAEDEARAAALARVAGVKATLIHPVPAVRPGFVRIVLGPAPHDLDFVLP